jgi:hypothetical protein
VDFAKYPYKKNREVKTNKLGILLHVGELLQPIRLHMATSKRKLLVISYFFSLKCDYFFAKKFFQKVPLTIFAWELKKICNSKYGENLPQTKSLGKFSKI